MSRRQAAFQLAVRSLRTSISPTATSRIGTGRPHACMLGWCWCEYGERRFDPDAQARTRSRTSSMVFEKRRLTKLGLAAGHDASCSVYDCVWMNCHAAGAVQAVFG